MTNGLENSSFYSMFNWLRVHWNIHSFTNSYLYNNFRKHPKPLHVATSAVYVTVILVLFFLFIYLDTWDYWTWSIDDFIKLMIERVYAVCAPLNFEHVRVIILYVCGILCAQFVRGFSLTLIVHVINYTHIERILSNSLECDKIKILCNKKQQ